MTTTLDWEGVAITLTHRPNGLNTGYDHLKKR